MVGAKGDRIPSHSVPQLNLHDHPQQGLAGYRQCWLANAAWPLGVRLGRSDSVRCVACAILELSTYNICAMAKAESQPLPTLFGFLLLDDFTLLPVSSAIETVRMANCVAGSQVFRWQMISRDGGPVTASDGLSINADFEIGDESQSSNLDAIFVCGGTGVERFAARPVLRWLRACSGRGIALGSTSTGSYVLAKAGLLNGYRCSICWDNPGALTMEFPQVSFSRGIYTIDRDRFTSAGGTAPMDMMLYFVRRRLGLETSANVAQHFVQERLRNTRDRKHELLSQVVGGQSAKLAAAVELMESNIREPFSQAELASYVGLSRRQLQRLFKRYLMRSPSNYYLRLRLERARQMLFQTDLQIVEISSQTGFGSSSLFSANYKARYGKTPGADRAARCESAK